MRRHYVFFAAVVVIGLGAVFLLIPGERELAYLHLKDKVFGTARETYEQRFAAGDLSPSVVQPLVQLHLQYGDADKAIQVLERYLEKNPDGIDARLQLATLYQWAQRPGDYLRKLEEINRLQPSEQNLRRLSALYNFTAQYEKQIAVLKELVEGYPATTDDMMNLATLQASLGRLGDAISTLRRLEKQHPQGVGTDVMALWLSLLLDTKNEKRAFVRARGWLAAHPDPGMAGRFASIFKDKRQAPLALHLLQPFEATADKNPELLLVLTRVEMETGRANQAFARLKSLYTDGRLPDAALESFIELALARDNPKLALEAAKGKDPSLLSGWLLTSLARTAITSKRPQAAQQMLESLGKEFLNSRPVLAAELALALQKDKEAARWVTIAEGNPGLSHEQRIALVDLYIRLGRKGNAIRALRRLATSESMPTSSPTNVAELYLKLGRATEGLKLFERLRSSHPSPQVDAAWARVAAGAGNANAVVVWLDQADAEAVSDQLLKDLYFLANDAGTPTLALASAERLYRRRRGKRERLQLAKALVAVGRPGAALPHLRALLREGYDVEETYVAALSGAQGAGAPVAHELKTFLARKLTEAHLRDEKREEFAYRLTNLGAYRTVLPTLLFLARRKGGSWLFDYVEAALKADQKDLLIESLKHDLDREDLSREKKEVRLYLLLEHGGEVTSLPYLRKFAETFGGEWTFAYEEALGKLGHREALLTFWKNRTSRTDVSPDEKRSIAFRMLEAGHKQSAEKVFFALASDAPPESPDVSQLLFLWGPQPDPSALDWIEERARLASGSEKAGWLNHLVNAGAPQRAVAIVEASSEPPHGPVLYAYLNALVEAHDRDRLATVMDHQLSTEGNPKRLRRLARLALQENLTITTQRIFRKLLKAKPDDQEALMWLGRLAFFGSRYATAKRYLGRYLASGEADYESHFYYGEILRRENGLAAAKDHYERALQQIGRLSVRSPRSELFRAKILARLGRFDDSVALFEKLLQQRPDDSDVRAEFAALLLDNGKYERAEQILSPSTRSNVLTVDPRAAQHAKGGIFSRPSSVEEVKTSLATRELLLPFDRPIEAWGLEKLRKPLLVSTKSISDGYRTALLRPARDRHPKVRTISQGVPPLVDGASTAKGQGSASEDRLRLDLLRARLLMQTGRERSALQLLRRLNEDYPQNPKVWASLAELEGQVGRWRRAYDFYGRTLKLDPENEDYQEARARLWREEAPRLRMDTTWVDVEKGEEERIIRLSGHHFINFTAKFLRMGFALEQNHLEINNVRRAEGQIVSFDGVRWRGEIYLQYDAHSGPWIRASLFPAPYGVGGGLLYARPDLAGETRLLLDVKRPNWEFVEGVVDDGSRDRLEIRRSQRLTPLLEGRLASALNRYGIDGDSQVATSVSLNGGLRYVLSTARPIISIGYELDKEYRASIDERTSPSGVKFNPLPLASREIHSIDLHLSQALSPALRVEGSAGYALDRLGDQGPFGGVAVTYGPLKRLDVQLSFQRSLNPTESSQTVNRVGTFLMWRF
ncbi:MAG: tetratricopeptide repeat protein [Candidatus Binatia bacterium]